MLDPLAMDALNFFVHHLDSEGVRGSLAWVDTHIHGVHMA